MQLKKTYGSREVAAQTGLTARQLQLWDAGGLLVPAMRPTRTSQGGYTERRYTPLDVFDLLVLADLKRRGFSVQQLHTVVNGLKKAFGVRPFDATGGGTGIQLLTDKEAIYARGPGGEWYDLLKSPPQRMLIVADERRLREVRGKVRRRKRRPAGPARLS